MEIPQISQHSRAVNNVPRAWRLPTEGRARVPRTQRPPFVSIIHDLCSPYKAGKVLNGSFSFHLSASVSLRLLASGRGHLRPVALQRRCSDPHSDNPHSVFQGVSYQHCQARAVDAGEAHCIVHDPHMPGQARICFNKNSPFAHVALCTFT